MLSALVSTGNTDHDLARREKLQAEVVVETLDQLQRLIAQSSDLSTF